MPLDLQQSLSLVWMGMGITAFGGCSVPMPHAHKVYWGMSLFHKINDEIDSDHPDKSENDNPRTARLPSSCLQVLPPYLSPLIVSHLWLSYSMISADFLFPLLTVPWELRVAAFLGTLNFIILMQRDHLENILNSKIISRGLYFRKKSTGPWCK